MFDLVIAIMKKNSLESTIVQLLCVSKLLMQRQFGSDKRLALIILDIAVEIALKSYAIGHNLPKIDKSNTKTISSILAKLQEQNKLVSYEKNSILKYHMIAKKLYNIQKPTILTDKTIEDYSVLARILLANLYDFRASKAEWQNMISKTVKSFRIFDVRK